MSQSEARPNLFLILFFSLSVGIYAGRDLSFRLCFLSLLLLAALLLCVLRKSASSRLVALVLITVFIGASLIHLQIATVRNGEISRAYIEGNDINVRGKVVSIPSLKNGVYRFFLATESYLSGGRWLAATDRIYVRATIMNGAVPDLFSGEWVVLSGKASRGGKAAGWLLDHGAILMLEAKSGEIETLPGRAGLISRSVDLARRWLGDRLSSRLSGEASGLVCGLLTGNKEGVGPGTRADLKSCGASHILSVSGLHVGTAAAFAFGLMRLLRFPRVLRYAGSILFALLITAVSGFPPSALRALQMAFLANVGRLSGREYENLTGVSVAGIIMLGFNPRLLFEPGFQLSFAATISILLVLRNSGARFIRSAVLVCAGSQLAVIPILLILDERIPTSALIANIIIAPLVGPLIGLGFLLAFVDPFSSVVAKLMAVPVSLLSSVIFRTATFFSGMPKIALTGSVVSLMAVSTYYLSLVEMVRSIRNGTRRFNFVVGLCISVLLAVTPFVPIPGIAGKKGPCVIALNVGQGDSFLFRDSAGNNVLVDGGPHDGDVTSRLQQLGIRRLEAVFLTHPHADHAEGVLDVLTVIPTGCFIDCACGHETSIHKEIMRIVEQKGIRCVTAEEEMHITVSDELKFFIISAGSDAQKEEDDLNGDSVVMLGELAGRRILMTADIGEEEERRLIRKGADLDCDLLKVPHQGSRDGAEMRFYEACSPKVALIAVGKNSYGHPSDDCLEKLATLGVATFRTDLSGEITVSFKDGKIGVSTSK